MTWKWERTYETETMAPYDGAVLVGVVTKDGCKAYLDDKARKCWKFDLKVWSQAGDEYWHCIVFDPPDIKHKLKYKDVVQFYGRPCTRLYKGKIVRDLMGFGKDIVKHDR